MILKNCQPAKFIRRYKRFLVDVELPDATVITVHCPNTGSMRGCLESGCPVQISRSDNPKRKYPHTLEMTRVAGEWIGVNTMRTNHLVREAIEAGTIAELPQFTEIRPEVKVSDQSRLDFLIISDNNHIYIEVKNCTLVEEGVAMFPDAVSKRASKHLEELSQLVRQGHRAMIFYCVQRGDGRKFSPARHIDPLYAETLTRAVAAGVEVVAYQALVQPTAVVITRPLPILL
ncbi:MAG: DNA/RNA nuclease SfsA [Thermodesulfobacteriota bacterium]